MSVDLTVINAKIVTVTDNLATANTAKEIKLAQFNNLKKITSKLKQRLEFLEKAKAAIQEHNLIEDE